MMGIMGIGANILKWTEEEKKVARKMVEKYKKIRYVVQFGDLYRIRSPRDGKTTVVEYISKDKEEAYVFVFKNHSDLDGDIIKVPVGGLDPQMQYSAHGFTELATGKALMDQGLTISLTGAHQSVLLEIKKN